VSDFGMARTLQGSIYANNEILPVRWTAPEVFLFGTYFKESDIWSFGVTAWEILSFGKMPYFDIEDNKEVHTKVLSGYTLTKPDNCPQPLWNIIADCFIYEHKQRSTFKELARMLSEYLSDVFKIKEKEYEYSIQFSQVFGGYGIATSIDVEKYGIATTIIVEEPYIKV